MSTQRKLTGVAGLLGAVLLATPAAAATECFIDAVATAAFGIYDGTQNDGAATTIRGRCSNTPPPGPGPTITPVLSLSTGLAASYAPRQMANGAFRLNYNLYTSVARSVVWGNGSAGTAPVPAYLAGSISLNGNQTRVFDNPGLTIYGRIPAGQTAGNGSYTDTVTLTLMF